MITKKKKYTLYYVMALACGLVASFFIYSCSADGYYSDEIEKNEVITKSLIDSPTAWTETDFPENIGSGTSWLKPDESMPLL